VKSQSIKSLYLKLATLLSEYRSKPFGQTQLNASLTFTEQLMKTAKQQPDVVFAQLYLYKSHLPYGLNLCFNCCLATLLVCVRNKVNDSTTQQLLCSAITLFSFEQSEVEQHYANQGEQSLGHLDKRLQSALRQTKQDVWLSSLTITSLIHHAMPATKRQLLSLGRLKVYLYIGAHLALWLTPNERNGKLSYAKIMQKLVHNCPTPWLEWIAPLLEYPCLIPAGSAVKYAYKYYIILSVTEQGYIARLYAANKQAAECIFIDAQSNITPLAPQGIASLKHIDNWWDEQWQEYMQAHTGVSIYSKVFKIDSPPALLLALQKQLNKTEPDIDKVVKLIAQDPHYARYLQTTASQNSRQKLPVQDVRHGLMIHGFGRSSSILMQQALLQRLTQHYFPLQEHFIHFTKLRAHLAATLAQESMILLPEEAMCLATFANAGLFTVAKLKSRTSWVRSANHLFDINQLSEQEGRPLLAEHAYKLAKAWQQEPRLLDALSNQHCLPHNAQGGALTKKLVSILGLSLIQARQLYFADLPAGDNNQLFIQQACEYLKLSEQQLKQSAQQAAGFCHFFWPLAS
jgi:HD-like signal output (HDOD) protein